jgi:hypothetical protein
MAPLRPLPATFDQYGDALHAAVCRRHMVLKLSASPSGRQAPGPQRLAYPVLSNHRASKSPRQAGPVDRRDLVLRLEGCQATPAPRRSVPARSLKVALRSAPIHHLAGVMS